MYSDAGFTATPNARQAYHAQAHTSASRLGAIATAANPGLLVPSHQLFFGASEEQLLREVRSNYASRVVSEHDLQRF